MRAARADRGRPAAGAAAPSSGLGRGAAPPGPSTYAPVVNLPFQAALTLHISAVHKERCRAATVESGFVCLVVVDASTAYAPHLRRRIEARFVEGTRGWLALSPRSLDPVTTLPLQID